MAILLVEKSDRWPLRRKRIKLQLLLRKIHYKLPGVLKCAPCSSFWLSFFSDLIVGSIALLLGYFYFFWPFSGAITAGITWTIIEFLNAIDKEPNINIFNDIKGD